MQYNKKDIFVPVLLGTARVGRKSELAARFVVEQVKAYGLKTQLVDVRDLATAHTIPVWEKSEKTTPWRTIVAECDGLIVVAPEYNHGYPGELKIVLDQAYKEYEKKPVGLCGVAGGTLGGSRVVENLRPVFVELSMVLLRNAVYFSRVESLFDEKGAITDESYKERVKKFLDELYWYAVGLKQLRAQSDTAKS
jgi:NAD(P)H-dependent FMN reductase